MGTTGTNFGDDALADEQGLAPSSMPNLPASAPATPTLAPQPKPVGPGRHLLTGLVGVLIDGLQAGMQAPMSAQGPSQAAAMGAQMPAQRQQQQINLQTQKAQMESMVAQSHIQRLQTFLLLSRANDELIAGVSHANWQYITDAVNEGRAKQVGGDGDFESASTKRKELVQQNRDTALHIDLYPTAHDKNGMPTQWGVFESYPKDKVQEAKTYTFPGNQDRGGKIPDKTVAIKPGMDTWEAKSLFDLGQRDQAALVTHDDDRMKAEEVQKQKSQTALDVAGIKAAQKPAAGAGKEESRSDKSYQYNQTRLDKIRTPIDGLAARFSRLQDALNQNTPQADALIAPELLTVMAGGQGSGLRMNEAEISRIVGGRSKLETLKASANKWRLDPRTALSITPEQRNEIRALVTEVGKKINAKQAILSKAGDDLVRETVPEKHRQIIADTQKQLDSIDTGKFPDRETATAVRNAQQPIFAKNPKTGARVQSTDGGKTWQAVP